MLVLPAGINGDGYGWRITPSGRATCPPCLRLKGKIVGMPLARTRSPGYTGTTLKGSTGTPVTDTPVPVSNGTYRLPGLEHTTTMYSGEGERSGIVGGVGEENQSHSGKSRRRDFQIPERLQEFDAILSRHRQFAPTRNARRRYEPNERYFARIMERYAAVPGMDFAEQAELMMSWALDHPQRVTDICRFSERWLEIAEDKLYKLSRRSQQNGRRPNGANTVANRYQMGASGLSEEARKSARDVAARGGAHYDER
jgi:hypothetical protein